VLGIVAAAVLLLVFGALWWRQAVIAALILAVFEGALRKWVFPEHGQFIYLMKDLLLVGAYAGFWGPRLIRRRRLVSHHPANAPLALVAAVAAVELLNPWLPNIAVGLFGIKAYLGYVPLMFLVPAVVTDNAKLQRLWWWFSALSLVPLLLGPVQFAAPPESVLNRYAWEDELAPGVAGFGEARRVRITGTFAYLSGYTAHLTLLVLVGLALLAVERRPWFRRGLYAVLALAGANLLMTGSRGPFLMLAGAVPAMVLLSSAGMRQRWRLVLVSGTAIIVATLVASSLFPAALDAFIQRAEQSDDLGDRLVGVIRKPVWALGGAGLVGWGIGTTHQATAFLIPAAATVASPPPAEGEWERIILEVGPLGFFLVVLARLLVSWRAWQAWRHAGAERRPFMAATLIFSLASLPGSLVFNHTASLFYWFVAGLPLMLPEQPERLERGRRHTGRRPALAAWQA
jgi:hypothetical protein